MQVQKLTKEQITKKINTWPSSMPILGARDFCKGDLVSQRDSNGHAVTACLMGWAGESFGLRGLEQQELTSLVQDHPTTPFGQFVTSLANEKIGTIEVAVNDKYGLPLIGLDGKPVVVVGIDPEFDAGSLVDTITSYNDYSDVPMSRLAEKWNRTVRKSGYTVVL